MGRKLATYLLLWVGVTAPALAEGPGAVQEKLFPPACHRNHTLVLPFRYVHGLILLSLELNGGPPQAFLLDSGASSSLLDRSTVAARGITTSYSPSLSVQARTTVEQGALIAHQVRIRSGRWTLLTGNIPALDLSAMSKALGFPVAGVIGFDYMQAHPLLIDYESRSVTIFLGHSLDRDLFAGVQLDIPQGAPLLHALLELPDGQHLNGAFTVDTGADSGIEFNDAFLEENGLTGDGTKGGTRALSATGARYSERTMRIRKFSLGEIQFADPVVRLAQGVKAGILAGAVTDGEIGNRILEQCGRVLIDPRDGMLELGRRSDGGNQ
jgi:Aspartyl protease